MALSPSVIEQIRAEVGSATVAEVDSDAKLEEIYNDPARGNSSVLRTALFVYRRRLNDYQSRAWDATTGGALMSRSQRARFLKARVAELEFALGTGAENRAPATQDDLADFGTESELAE